jgi:hypothetical protein
MSYCHESSVGKLSLSKLRRQKRKDHCGTEITPAAKKTSGPRKDDGDSDKQESNDCIIEILSSDEESSVTFNVQTSKSTPIDNTFVDTEVNDHDTLPRRQRSYYQDSAYVQNLAEISYDILHDARWRVTGNRLFRWELGDDLNAVLHFSRFFHPREDMSDHVMEEEYSRCMHLVARLFYRRGPWFCFSDVFMRYYHRDYRRREAFENNETKTVQFDDIVTSLKDFLNDLHRLNQMGLIRTYESEIECGTIAGSSYSKLLTEKEKEAVLKRVGGKSKSISNNRSLAHDQNQILKQMRSQRGIFSQKNGVLPIRKHVDIVLLDSFAEKVQSVLCTDSRVSKATILDTVKDIWRHLNMKNKSNTPLMTTFTLREKPLLCLRRAARLYLCAGEGPGSMRWTGNNPWITVFDCDSPEDFHKISMDERRLLKGICSLPDPPTSTLWYQVVFPGLNSRMGLESFSFTENYSRLPFSEHGCNAYMEIFESYESFRLFESGVELRCSLDYLTEWNRLFLYAIRKLKLRNSDSGATDVSKDVASLKPCLSKMMDLLSTEGRLALLRTFSSGLSNVSIVHNNVEEVLHSFSLNENGDSFLSDAERAIVSIGLICQYILLDRFEYMNKDYHQHFVKRPWLRHLNIDSILAYIVWDTVDIIEKRGYHDVACRMLDTILFGFTFEKTLVPFENYEEKMKDETSRSRYVQLLLSRRVRGKAFERLSVDKKHCKRKSEAVEAVTIAKVKQKKNHAKSRSSEVVDTFTSKCLDMFSRQGSIPFSFIRKFSKRIKRPLMDTTCRNWNLEMLELGIRVSNEGDCDQDNEQNAWTPTVDESIANAIKQDSFNGHGGRCSFVGHEENSNGEHHRSLNVEELAIQEYSIGRLPADKSHNLNQQYQGGWKGWHAEGFHVRLLFRLLCTKDLLGFNSVDDELIKDEQYSVFLNPYQRSPLDLHVAHGILYAPENSHPIMVRSFFERRKSFIEDLLSKISQLSAQGLSDLVHNSISKRLAFHESKGRKLRHDPILCKDIKELKIISMVASGFGGKLISCMFRCLCYDYRHYGAGLPDLLLVRALKIESKQGPYSLLDLNEWIGEEIADSLSGTMALSSSSRDDEFLGGIINEKQSLSTKKSQKNSNDSSDIDIKLPDRLKLVHGECEILVECLFVEVKSANDRLDERQEDWLNILDKFGHARLCQFRSSNARK